MVDSGEHGKIAASLSKNDWKVGLRILTGLEELGGPPKAEKHAIANGLRVRSNLSENAP